MKTRMNTNLNRSLNRKPCHNLSHSLNPNPNLYPNPRSPNRRALVQVLAMLAASPSHSLNWYSITDLDWTGLTLTTMHSLHAHSTPSHTHRAAHLSRSNVISLWLSVCLSLDHSVIYCAEPSRSKASQQDVYCGTVGRSLRVGADCTALLMGVMDE